MQIRLYPNICAQWALGLPDKFVDNMSSLDSMDFINSQLEIFMKFRILVILPREVQPG